MKLHAILGASALSLFLATSAEAQKIEVPGDEPPPAESGSCVLDFGACPQEGSCSGATICYQGRCAALGDTSCASQAECGGALCVATAGNCGAGCPADFVCESGFCLKSINPTVGGGDADGGAAASCDGGACEDVGAETGLDAGTEECSGVECQSGEPTPTPDEEPEAQPTTAAPTGSADDTSDTTGDDGEKKSSSASNCSAAPGVPSSNFGLFALMGLGALVMRRRR